MVKDRQSLRERYKALRKRWLDYLPLMKRRRHHKLMAQWKRDLAYERAANESLGRLFLEAPSLAATARSELPVAVRTSVVDELCLFVTHAPSPALKPHVIDHIGAMNDAGIAVFLVVNADFEPKEFQLPSILADRLYGCLVRENVGFDFAAWAHAYAHVNVANVRIRLFCVNDSIIGPLNAADYRTMLAKIRNASADFVGLTGNPDPHDHLQSYYLVFNQRLLHSPVLDGFMRRVVNMPLKQNVIDCYEIWLTRFLERNGFSSAAIFPPLSRLPPPRRNDTLVSWKELLEIGFPFVKSMVLREPTMAEDVRSIVPERYREPFRG